MALLKSIGSVLAGFGLIFILAIALDHLLENVGLMQIKEFNFNASWVIAVVVVCRFAFNVAGPYLTARLSPKKPMLHAVMLGIMGTLVNAAGCIVMWNKTPHWFPLILIVMPLPCAWIGGKLSLADTPSSQKHEAE